MSHITPFVKRMRTQGGSVYCFASSVEDIGLNINERNNVVKMSHYALLNIPSIVPPDVSIKNTFNVYGISGAYEYYNSANIKDARVLIAENFQNYALNLETNLLAQATYNPALNTTVSERVFWKWLKETGAIRWIDSSIANDINYWEEETDTETDTGVATGYNSVVKSVGLISAGSVRTDSFGTYNETYVLVPTSFGQTKAYFKEVEDDNYSYGMTILPSPGEINILGRESYMKPHPDGLSFTAFYDTPTAVGIISPDVSIFYYSTGAGLWYGGGWPTAEGIAPTGHSYYTDIEAAHTWGGDDYNIYLNYTGATNVEFWRSKIDCLSLEFDLDHLKTLYNDSALTFDKMANDYAIDNNYNFNSVLIYYSVYNKSLDTVLATNLLGILFLDNPGSGTWPTEITMPSIEKLQSGVDGFGTSYSFRLNIKSDYMLDDSKAIVDDNTASQENLSTFSEIFDGLNKSLNILNQHTSTINYVSEQYNNMSSQQSNILNSINDISYQVNDITQDITGTEGAIAMFIAGDDPIGDSSIYMKNGKLGIFTNNPTYKVQVDVSMKTKDIILENNIRDTSGNILLGYGSPLQLGSLTNLRDVNIYTGYHYTDTGPPFGQIYPPAISIDTSNRVTLNGLQFGDGAGIFTTSDDRRGFPIKDNQMGTGLTWAAGNLYVEVNDVSGGVSAAYVDGSLAFRDISINYIWQVFASNASVNLAFLTNASLGNLSTRMILTEASVNLLTSKLSITDASLLNVKATYIPNVSLGTDFYWDASGFLEITLPDVSGLVDYAKISYVDGSIATLNASVNTALGAYATNASIATAAFAKNASFNLYYTKLQTDASFAFKVDINSSTNVIWTKLGYVDTSLNNLGIKDAAQDVSLNDIWTYLSDSEDASLWFVQKAGDTMSGDLTINSSLFVNGKVGINKIPQYTLDVSGIIGVNQNKIVNIGTPTDSSDATNKFYVDSSFALKVDVNTSTNAIWINFGLYATNSSINTTLGAYATNASIATAAFAKNASFNLYYTKLQTDASFALKNKTFQNLTIDTSTITWSIATGYNAKVTLTTNVSLNITDVSNGDSGTLIVMQDPSGSRLLNLPVTSYINNAWILSTDGSARDVISFLYDGSNYYWNKGGPYA